MAERRATSRNAPAALEIAGLNVFYGHSHALQGVNLKLERGILSVVGRNGMGKTTLCRTIMGLIRPRSGSIRFAGEELTRLAPTDIARLGVGYVPQGRRLWRSLSVDEHLRLVAASARTRGAWSIERIYDTYPRLAERKGNGGGQLSGGEQQMLAISRALLLNPRLLVMDEPTEGLAPVIVAQVEDMLLKLADSGEMSVLVIEQNIGVACAIAETVAIMVNGRVNRTIDSHQLAADRDLQQRLLGVGRHAHDENGSDAEASSPAASAPPAGAAPAPTAAPTRIYVSNPELPTRWSAPLPLARVEATARVVTVGNVVPLRETARQPRPGSGSMARPEEQVVLVVGTLDTKGAELRYLRDLILAAGLKVRLVDTSTSATQASADVARTEIALHHRAGAGGVFTRDRGTAVTGMGEAFEAWIRRQHNIAGIVSAGGSGGTSIATRGMRALPVGVPKLMISTVASGDVAGYVGASDILMMYSVTDVQGLNSISRQVLANGAEAMVGMVKARLAQAGASRGPARGRLAEVADLPAVGLTMFGVTTPCVEQITRELQSEFDCLVFHATGSGGQSMEKLVDSGLLTGVIDVTTTEVCDLLVGGVMPATEDRLGAVIRTRVPYVGSCGALDMVNFGTRVSVPKAFEGRLLYQHNPGVTLMRTTPAECAHIGQWIAERLNRMDGPVRFFIPEKGVSALDAAGQPFHDPEADAALFRTLETSVRRTQNRQLVRLPLHINDPAFARALVDAFHSLQGTSRRRRQTTGGP
jgi:uncharacterized protein (UPF0261 family)/ABC-type branched-subunit amino acid transport system ATPase component